MATYKSISKISKWGNGYAIRIPIDTLHLYKLIEGSEVILSKEEKGLTISPRIPSCDGLSLAEIMKGVTPSQLAREDASKAFGVPQGNEIW